jgi:hypothetical protein
MIEYSYAGEINPEVEIQINYNVTTQGEPFVIITPTKTVLSAPWKTDTKVS